MVHYANEKFKTISVVKLKIMALETRNIEKVKKIIKLAFYSIRLC